MSDDISSTQHWLRRIFGRLAGPLGIKGADGATIVSASNRLPVDASVSVTLGEVEIKNDTGNPVPVSAASLPLPTGAATETTLGSIKTAVETIDNAIAGSEMQVDLVTLPTDVTSSGNITANGQSLNPTLIQGGSDLGFQVTGAWTGQLEFEVTVDGATWVASRVRSESAEDAVNATVSNGVFIAPVAGVQGFRVRASSFSSGTASIFFRASVGIHTVNIASPIPSGTNNIGDVDVVSSALPTGAATSANQLDESVTPLSVTTSVSGNTPVVTPAAGKAIRLFWYGFSASPDNTASVSAGMRWTTAGTNFVVIPLSQYGGQFGHSFKAGRSYIQGAANEALVLNLSAAQSVTANIDYTEVTP